MSRRKRGEMNNTKKVQKTNLKHRNPHFRFWDSMTFCEYI